LPEYIAIAFTVTLTISCMSARPAATDTFSATAGAATPEEIHQFAATDLAGSNDAQGLLCREIKYPVSISPGGAQEYTVACWLTAPQNAGETMLITIPGAAYSHVYWDFPYKPGRYSFVQNMADAGYSTLNIDRMGSGDSSKPQGYATTIDAQAYVVHQIVQALRQGKIGGVPYKKSCWWGIRWDHMSP